MTNKERIGIDLGTTFSCCGIFKTSKVNLVSWSNLDTNKLVIENESKINPKSNSHDDCGSNRFPVFEGNNDEKLVRLTSKKKTIQKSANDISADGLKKEKERADNTTVKNLIYQQKKNSVKNIKNEY